MKKSLLFAGLAAFAAFVAPAAHADDVVEIAMSDPQFSTLVKAVKAAGLVDALKTTQGITVFAPTNAAFAKIPKATLASLLKPENKAKLAALLKYHVVPSKIMAKDVLAMSGPKDVKSLAGPTIYVSVKPSPMVNKAKITKTDIVADNGVIHVIDTVIMPTDKVPGKMNKMGGGKMGGKMDKMAPM
ncbi:MAG: fasciclin domain-containing protein [Armatimonadetes bacterium]|nr:fasciclin domain-containing protein [Armatimonadota bacterium]